MPRFAARYNELPEYPLAHIPRRKRELLARGVDVIDLGAGDDVVNVDNTGDAVSGGVNSVTGGDGNDTIDARNGRRDSIDCGPRRDVVHADRKDVVRHCEVRS